MLDFLKNISPSELIIIVVILVVLFGSKIIVGVAKTGGETFKEIKKVKKVFTEMVKDDDKPGKK